MFVIFCAYRMMKAMAEHTKMGPPARIERLLIFNKRLEDAQQTQPTMRDWNLELESALVEVNGRQLPYENIVFGNDRKCV